MRSDMAQMLVEHPRHRSGERYRTHRRKANRDPEEALTKQGMRRPYKARKEFGEYFPPVLGYLRKQVGRPWDKVFSELNAALSGGGTVVDHVKTHVLRDFVTLKPEWHNGVPCYPPHDFSGRDEPRPITRSRNAGFYVDRHGLLRQAPARAIKWRKPKPLASAEDQSAYYKIDSVWYEVWFKDLPAPAADLPPVYDLVLKCWVRCKHFPVSRFHFTDEYRWEVDGHHRVYKLIDTHGSARVAYRREQVSSRVIRRERLNERLQETGE